jgi:hypothetical protein
VQIEAAAKAAICNHATFTRHATLLLRYAMIVLDDVIVAEPMTVAATEPLSAPGQKKRMDETLVAIPPGEASPRLISLVGVDCSQLVVTDVDLSQCHFAGSLHLDQLRVEGACRFAEAPAGWTAAKHWPPIWHGPTA